MIPLPESITETNVDCGTTQRKSETSLDFREQWIPKVCMAGGVCGVGGAREGVAASEHGTHKTVKARFWPWLEWDVSGQKWTLY